MEKFKKVVEYKSLDWIPYLFLGVVNLFIHFSSTPYTNNSYFNNLGASGFPLFWITLVILSTIIIGLGSLGYSIVRFIQVREVYWRKLK